MHAIDHFKWTAAFHGIPEIDQMAQVLDLYPDAFDCTGDDDNCECRWHQDKRMWTMDNINEINRMEYLKWLMKIISRCRCDIPRLKRTGRLEQVKAMTDLMNELKSEMERFSEIGSFPNG